MKKFSLLFLLSVTLLNLLLPNLILAKFYPPVKTGVFGDLGTSLY